MLVQDFLRDSAQRLPDKTALVCRDRRLTYAEIDAMTNRLANALTASGVRRGDRVALYLDNSVEAVIGIFATLKAGGVFVVVHPTTKHDKLAFILNDCEARALIFDSRKASIIESLSPEVPSLKACVGCGKLADEVAARHDNWLSLDAALSTYPDDLPPQVTITRDLACLIYTSGSTGFPKGVMCDHRNVDFVSGSIITYLENVEDDIVISALPLSFDYGLYQLLMTFRFGGTLVLERDFVFPAAVFKRMETERVTGFPIVPTMMASLLQMDLSKYDLSSLRYITNTAAALPPCHIAEFQQRFSHVTIFSMYGLTETKRTLYLPPEQLEARPDSVGIAIPGTEVWIEDEEGNRLGPGEIGELVIRGEHVMRGYWHNEEATNKRFRPGSLPGERVCYSGDLFSMDDEGYLYFKGRMDDIIKCRGEKVAPKEIENVLYQLPGVVEAAVVGVPDPLAGEAIIAYVVVYQDTQLTESDVLAHCHAHLEDLMVPKYIAFCDELPKTSSGKIKKQGLV
jgi:long-chain acyl-CoA synthetase